jgi:hypothetical protein
MTKIIDFQTSRPIEETPPGVAQKPLNILELDGVTKFARHLDSVIRNGSYDPEFFNDALEYLRFACSVHDEDAPNMYRALSNKGAAR